MATIQQLIGGLLEAQRVLGDEAHVHVHDGLAYIHVHDSDQQLDVDVLHKYGWYYDGDTADWWMALPRIVSLSRNPDV
jgi:hypothetical protein